jgi:hypothetical protein
MSEYGVTKEREKRRVRVIEVVEDRKGKEKGEDE